MPTLVIRHPDGTQDEASLEGELTVGRAEGSGLVLASGGVSRRHARLFVDEEGGVWVEDLGSAHGTFLDGQRLEEASRLEAGQTLTVGDYELSLSAAAPPRRPAGTRRPARAPVRAARADEVEPPIPEDSTRSLSSRRTRPPPAGAPGALARRPGGTTPPVPSSALSRPAENPGGPHLRGAMGPWLHQVYPLVGKVVVGRQPGLGLFVDDASVSRRHAELEAGPDGVTLRDMGSANGTSLNGLPVGEEPMALEEGDRVRFGAVDFLFSAGEEDLVAVPTRRGGRTVPARRARGGAEGGAAPGRKRLVLALVGVVALVGLAGALKVLTGGPGAGEGQGRTPVAAGPTPEQQLQEHLSRCRSYSSLELGTPDWKKAREACNRALDIDPIHPEAHGLLKRIGFESEAGELYAKAEKALQRNNEEQALELFRQIPTESAYFRRAKTQALAAVDGVQRRALEDCKRYSRNGQWRAAADACLKHMNLVCPNIPREELVPPVGYTLSLRPRRGRNEWKPTHPDYVRFLTARQRAGLGREPWECPPADIFQQVKTGEEPKQIVEAEFKRRYPEKAMYLAMVAYWEGRAGESSTLLQTLRRQVSKAALHGEVDRLKRDVENVFQLYQNGQAALQEDDPETAAPAFDEALALDEKLVGAPYFENQPSFFRTSMHKELAETAYQSGKHWADRQDVRKACRLWKLGFSRYKGNIDLNKAVRFCSEQARQALQAVGGCPDLSLVEELMVPNDGIEELVKTKRTELACP